MIAMNRENGHLDKMILVHVVGILVVIGLEAYFGLRVVHVHKFTWAWLAKDVLVQDL